LNVVLNVSSVFSLINDVALVPVIPNSVNLAFDCSTQYF
jgi:hypothetical protein